MQDYYNITSDMPTDMMLSIAAENLETQKNLVVEEQRRAGLVKPLHIWISRWVGEKLENQTRKKRNLWTFKWLTILAALLCLSSALSPTCNVLIPNLLSAEVFPSVSAISIHLLDLDGSEEGLQWLREEAEDLALCLLHQV